MADEDTTTRYQLPGEVFQAEGKLSVLLDVPIERAVLALAQLAELRALTLHEAARVILYDDMWDPTLPTVDAEGVAVARRL